ncbi:hypothetical protein C6499_04350 [Candidatus Poribacteria bacterium]|nr:MAG: hypothetical protein C6499_04350 [Candidatus Poribacteria bacterium]
MLRFQIALAIILVGCVAFVACERGQQMLDPVDMTDTGDAEPMDMILDMIKMDTHKSWMSVMRPAPVPMVDATSPAETGAAHNPAHATTGITTARTFYINAIGVMANKEGTMYPAGTVIVKEIMDDTNMFVDKVAVMIKSDDAMYAGHSGWVYKKYARASADAEYMQVRGSNLEDAGNGCHGCHAKATNDSVFVSLMDDDMSTNGNGVGNGNGASAGNGAGNSNGNGAGAGNSAGNGNGAQ